VGLPSTPGERARASAPGDLMTLFRSVLPSGPTHCAHAWTGLGCCSALGVFTVKLFAVADPRTSRFSSREECLPVLPDRMAEGGFYWAILIGDQKTGNPDAQAPAKDSPLPIVPSKGTSALARVMWPDLLFLLLDYLRRCRCLVGETR